MTGVAEWFWAWLAGFIDGDGCLGIYRQEGSPAPRLAFTQKDRKILDHITDILETGSVTERSERCRQATTFGGAKAHQLAFGSGATREICKHVLPFLYTKKVRARAILDLPHQKPGPKKKE